jgi:hypothetical protein
MSATRLRSRIAIVISSVSIFISVTVSVRYYVPVNNEESGPRGESCASVSIDMM